MTAVLGSPGARPAAAAGRGAHWIDDWRPDDERFWEAGGARVARRNLVFSIVSEHIGFSVWTMWSVLVLFLGPAYGFAPEDKFLLTIVPALVGSTLRLPYTFAVARFGGRNWTVFSALLLLLPMLLALAVLEPGVSLGTLLLVSAVAGVGGGNFASSMANINAFYPDRLKGRALGLNAGGGNLGVPVVQLMGLLVLGTVGAAHPRVLVAAYVPLILVAAFLALRNMDNLTSAKNDKRAMRDVCRDPHTWVMSFLYIGTFGSFIGFGFAFGQVLQVQFAEEFPTPLDAAYLTFLGPLLGSLIRPVGGHARGPLRWRAGHRRQLRRHGRRRPARPGRLAAGVAAAVRRRLHDAVRAERARQRVDVQDDPGDLPRKGAGRLRPGGRRPRGAAAVGGPDRDRRRHRRLRRGPGERGLPAVLSGDRRGQRGLRGVPRLLRRVRPRHLDDVPPAGSSPACLRRSTSADEREALLRTDTPSSARVDRPQRESTVVRPEPAPIRRKEGQRCPLTS